jgi:hypothetical protein
VSGPEAKAFRAFLAIQAEVTGAWGAPRRILCAMKRARFCWQLLFGALAFAVLAPAPGSAKRQVVVELFTSQGCNSCPPADALIGHLADHLDLMTLSLPVTYWDMLGWKDTLASEANTRRQKSYAGAMGRGGIYTPQIIVDGITDVVGSREAQLEAAISARRSDMREVPLNVSASPEAFHVVIGALPEKTPGDATVWLFHVLGHVSVPIGAGENKGRKIEYRNVVRDVRAVAIWKGQPLSLDVPRADQGAGGYDAIAVVVQENGYGRVIGARAIGLPEYAQQH